MNMAKTKENQVPELYLKDGVEAFNQLLPDMMRNLLHNMPGIAYRCRNDSKWTMLFLSDGCFALTGYQPEELLYNSVMSFEDLILPEDRSLVRNAVIMGVKNRRSYQMEYRIRTREGTVKWVWEQGNAVFDAARNPRYLDGLITDISPRKQLEEELQANAAELSRLNVIKDKFFTIIAHDLQNPVYAIISLGEFISQNYQNFNPRELDDFIRQINSSAKSIYQLLENLLDWTRAQTGSIQIQNSHFRLLQLVEQCLETILPHARSKEVEFQLEIPRKIYLYCDQHLTEVILRSLIFNAVKYSQPNSTVKVLAEKRGSEIAIMVEDQGVGIPRSEIANLFKIGSDFRRPGTGNESGTGLGLILVHDFVRRMKGSISVESKANRYTRFTVLLPGVEKRTDKD